MHLRVSRFLNFMGKAHNPAVGAHVGALPPVPLSDGLDTLVKS